MKYAIILFLVLLIPLVQAETTFFDQDNAFILGKALATTLIDSGIIAEAANEVTGEGCTYNWTCAIWSKCSPSEKQTRSCKNIGTCPSRYKTPEIEQNCTLRTSPAVEEEQEKEKGDGIIILINLAHKNKAFIYLIAALVICFIVFCLSKDYLKKLIKRQFKSC
jgi:hypothetical protein